MSRLLIISIKDQRLQLRDDYTALLDFSIATASKGVGEENGSECTPRGWHVIQEKIGAGADINSVFVGRESTGEIYSKKLEKKHPDRDWILSRILWLSGLESGKNRSGSVDTGERYIYIHGCPDDVKMGIPSSHGCIRMRNDDVITLYNSISEGIAVLILEDSLPSATPTLPYY